jgi:cytochrome c5
MDQVVRDTLGEEAVPKMREFIATADLREVADKLAANTFHTDTPLNAQQAERFVQTCMDCRTQPGDGIRNLPDAVDWEKALRQAESFLTPTQLSVLRTMTDMRRFDQVFKQSTGLTYRPPVRNF